jgi:MFS transporter, DHA2 family, multidrug resistance protein
MRYIQIRYVVGCGFLCLGLAMVYAHGLSPQIDFTTLALMRGAQAACVGLLFAPISTLAYRTLPTKGAAMRWRCSPCCAISEARSTSRWRHRW